MSVEPFQCRPQLDMHSEERWVALKRIRQGLFTPGVLGGELLDNPRVTQITKAAADKELACLGDLSFFKKKKGALYGAGVSVLWVAVDRVSGGRSVKTPPTHNSGEVSCTPCFEPVCDGGPAAPATTRW
jgi:hypothetical protein